MTSVAGDSLFSASERQNGKSDQAFFTIGEVEDELDVPQHVLRFWETKFTNVRPLKRVGGRRYYRPEDVALLRCIRDLLYNDGFTIKGVQKLLRENGAKAFLQNGVQNKAKNGANVAQITLDLAGASDGAGPPDAVQPVSGPGAADLKNILAELRQISAELRAALADK